MKASVKGEVIQIIKLRKTDYEDLTKLCDKFLQGPLRATLVKNARSATYSIIVEYDMVP